MSHFDSLNGGAVEGYNQLYSCNFICKLFEPSKKKTKSSLKQSVSSTQSLKLPQLDGRSVIISKKLSTGNDTFSFHRTFNQSQQPSDIARESIEPLMRKLVFEGSSLCIVHVGFKARKYSLDTVSNVDDGLYGVLLSDLFAKLAAGNLLNSQSCQASATIRLSIFDVSCYDESVIDLLSHENSILSVDSPMTAREIEDIDDFLEAIQVAESNPFKLETPSTRVCRLQIHGTDNYSELNILHLTINTATQQYYLALMKECSNKNNSKTKLPSSSQSLQQQQQFECGLSRMLSSGVHARSSQMLCITQLLNATSSHDANLQALKFSRKVQSIMRQDEEQGGQYYNNNNLSPSCYWTEQLYSQPLSTNPETPVHNTKNSNPNESLFSEINTLIISLKDALSHPPIDRPSVLFPQWMKHQQSAVDVLFQMIARTPEKQRVSFFEQALMIKSKLMHLAKISSPDRKASLSNKRTASSPNLKTPLKMFEYFETQQFELDSRRKQPENKRVSLSGSDFKISRNSSMKSFQAGNTPVGILNNNNMNGSCHSSSSIINGANVIANSKTNQQNQENQFQSGQYGSCRVKRLQKERQLLLTTNSDQNKHHNPSLFHKDTLKKIKKTNITPKKHGNTALFVVDNGYALPRKPALSRKQSILSEKSNISRKISKSQSSRSRSNSKSSIKSVKLSRQSNTSLSSASSKGLHNRSSTSYAKKLNRRRNSECSFSSPKKTTNLKSILVATPLKHSNKTKHSSFPSSPRQRTPILKRNNPQMTGNSPHSSKKAAILQSPRSSLKKKKNTLINIEPSSRSIRSFNSHRSGSMGQLSDIVSSESQMRNEFREQLKSKSKKKYQSAKEEVLNSSSSNVSSESDYEFFDRVTDMNRRTMNTNNNLASQRFKDMTILPHFDKELAFFDAQQSAPNAVELLKAFHSLIIKSMSMQKYTQELLNSHEILQKELQAEQDKYSLLQAKHLKRKKQQRIVDRDIQQQNTEYLSMKDEHRTMKADYQKINQKYNEFSLKVEQQANTIKHLERNAEMMQNCKQINMEQIQTEIDQKTNEILYLKDVIERQNRQEQEIRQEMNNQMSQSKHQQRVSMEGLSREVSMSQLSYKQLQTTHRVELEGLLQRVKLAEDQEESVKKQLSQVMKQLQEAKKKQMTEAAIAGILKKQKIKEKQQGNQENETILNALERLKNEHQSLQEKHKQEMMKAKEDKVDYERRLKGMEEQLLISKSLLYHHTKSNFNNNPKDSTGTTTTTSVHMSQPLLLSRVLTSPTEHQQGQTFLCSARSSYHQNNTNTPSITARAMLTTDSTIGVHSPTSTLKHSNNCYVKGNNRSNCSISNHPWQQHLRTHSNLEEFLLSSQQTLKKHQSTHEITQQLSDQQQKQQQISNQQSKIIESLIADRQPMSARTIVKSQQPISEQLFALTARGKQGSLGNSIGKDQKIALKSR